MRVGAPVVTSQTATTDARETLATDVPDAFQATETIFESKSDAWSSSQKTPWASLAQSRPAGFWGSSVSSLRPGAATQSPPLGCHAKRKPPAYLPTRFGGPWHSSLREWLRLRA